MLMFHHNPGDRLPNHFVTQGPAPVGRPPGSQACRAALGFLKSRPEQVYIPANRPAAPLRTLRPHRGLLVLPLAIVTVLEKVVSRLVITTTVLRVASPAVVVRSVIRALQVHAREGMPGLELVEPRGRSLLHPSWGPRVGLPFSRRTYPLLSRLRSHHRASGHLFLMPYASDVLGRLAVRVGGGRSVSHSIPWSSGSLVACLAHLVSQGYLVRGAPADLDLDRRPPFAKGCYRLPRLKGVGLARAGLDVRHPCDRGLCIGEDTDSVELSSLGPLRCHR